MKGFFTKNYNYTNILGFGPTKSKSVTKWYTADTEEKFDKHWSNSKTRQKLNALGWTKDSIEYRCNDAGFRMDINMRDVKSGECDFYLGCSYTFGIGLNMEDTWCWKMSLIRGLTCVNLGIPGGGMESNYRVLKSWIGILKPKNIYLLGYFPDRREIITNRNSTLRLGPWVEGDFLKKLYYTLLSDDEILLTYLRNFDAIRAICMDYNTSLYVLDENHFPNFDQGARDLLHPSRIWHTAISLLPDSSWVKIV